MATLLAAPTVHADLRWDPIANGPLIEGGSGRWNLTTPNWNDGFTNVPWDASRAIFGGLSAGLVVLDDSAGVLQTVSLTFNPTADASTYTLVSDSFDGIVNDDTLVFSGVAGVVTTHASALLKNRLGGAVGLTKEGAGTLVLFNTANPFTGNVVVNTGVLAFVGQATANPTVFGTGTKTVTVANNAVLRPLTFSDPSDAGGKTFVVGVGGATFDTPLGVSFALNNGSQFSGSGDLTKTGTGTLVLGSGSETGFNFSAFTGAITVDAGILTVFGDVNHINRTALGSVAAGTTIRPGGSLLIRGATNEPLTITGSGLTTGAFISTAIQAAAGTHGLLGGAVTLAGDTVVGGNGGLTFGGIVSGAFNFMTALTGSTLFTAANTYTGTTTVNTGTFTIGDTNGSALGSTRFTLQNGGTLRLANYGFNRLDRISDSAPIVFKGAKSTLELSASSGLATETAGAVVVENGLGVLRATRPSTGGAAALTVGSVSRSGQGALNLGYYAGGVLGGPSERIFVLTAPRARERHDRPVDSGRDRQFFRHVRRGSGFRERGVRLDQSHRLAADGHRA